LTFVEGLTPFVHLSIVGLAFIAGQLLLQSPEEDAFWIFISLMDSHLRPYFSSNSVQLDIDASLFSKAMETVDPSIAKKLFVDMGISPIRICRPWFVSSFFLLDSLPYSSFGFRFSSLFVEALPTEYFQRVWDIFLSEGACHSRLLSPTDTTDVQSRHGVSPPYRASNCDVLSPNVARHTPRG
jgi:hypothetical protein